jgi:serine protease Do
MPRSSSASALTELSTQMAGAVEAAAQSVVAIHARRRIASSGILWRDGVVVSASHTVQRDDRITITLPSGDSATATVAGRDAATDLIALRLNDVKAPAALRADAGADRVGSLVLAVGRPGRSVSASFGIVSSVHEGWRSAPGRRIDRVLRLDLAVYDGFSGGPLVDASGRVIGINNSALARGTPVALPAAEVDRVVDDLLGRGHVRHPFVGLAVHPVALGAALVAKHKLPSDTGLVIVSVADGAPADAAGVLVGDVAIEAKGRALGRPSDLLDAVSDVRDGASLEMRLLRGGNLKTVSVTPVDRAAGGADE